MNIFTPLAYDESVAVYVHVSLLSFIAALANARPVPSPTEPYAAHEVIAADGVYDTVNDVPLMSEMIMLPLVPDSVTVPSEEAAFTVMVFVADFPPAVAVMTAVPAATPVTVPVDELTVARLVLPLDHDTVLFVALPGFTVALRVIVLPVATELLPLIETPVTATVESLPLPVSSVDVVQPVNTAANINAANSRDSTGITFIFIFFKRQPHVIS